MGFIAMLSEICLAFFTALGVVLGASFVGSLATLLTSGSPLQTMNTLAKSVKLWAVVVAMGGTFPTIRAIESGLAAGEVATLLRQILIIIAGFSGALCGYSVVMAISGGE